MTTFIDRVVGGAGACDPCDLHTSDLGTFFAIPLALKNTYDDFQEKIYHILFMDGKK